MTEREPKFRARFAELLFPSVHQDRAAGWQLATALGRPATPLLWDMVRGERSEVERELVVLAAALLAGGPGDDARLFHWLEQPQPMVRERVLVALVLALGPTRSRPVSGFWPRLLGPGKEPHPLLQVAVRLAAARFPESNEGAPTFLGEDPGIAAASAFAGVPVAASVVARFTTLKSPVRHADLYRRALLLGAARRFRDAAAGNGVAELARDAEAQRAETAVDLRAAGMWWLARSGEWAKNAPTLDLVGLRVAVADGPTAQRLAAQLAAKVAPLDDAPRRLAVAYALHAPLQQVVDERAIWGAEARVCHDVALAFAWRVAGMVTPAIDVDLPGVAEWHFVRFASGGRAPEAATFDDPALAMASTLCREGRIERTALRDLLEQVLWQRGSHPGLEVWQQERRLIRDLLLTGSNFGGKYQPDVQLDLRYLPTGFDRGDPLFPIACQLFDFLMTPRGQVPAEHRLGQ